MFLITDFVVDEPADSSLSLKSEEDNTNEYSNTEMGEVTTAENRATDFGGFETNVTDTFLPRREEENHILASGFQKEGRTVDFSAYFYNLMFYGLTYESDC